MQFKMLIGDINWRVYGGKFVSKRLNNGEFDYWLVLEVINMWEATGDESGDQYAVQLLSVSPEQVKSDDLNRAFESCGLSSGDFDLNNPLIQVEALAEYGVYATLWSNTGNNIKSLLREAHKQANLSNMLFGFYMDRYQNRIGQTGWDVIRGQSVIEFYAERGE